ncbi:hypothetical protein E8E11_005101 [Didymella keratinophila]|nr:hypothetical protein E8E11_005101 [Didymella keratinophila]
MMTGGGNYWNEYADNQSEICDLQCQITGDATTTAHNYCDYFWHHGKKVLTVAKLGGWRGPMDKLRYPVQAIDAIRDLLQNIVWRILWVKFRATGKLGMMLGDFKRIALTSVADKALLPYFKAAAIAKAKKAIYIDAEIIGGFLHEGPDEWPKQLKETNANAQLVGDDQWNGVLWPYDLISTIATFLVNFKEEHLAQETVVAANKLKQRLRYFVERKTDDTDAEYTKWFDSVCQIRRISGDGSMFNHCKTYCVDKKMLYVGSNNPYPNYNEEHGVWVDDEAAFEAWYDRFFSPRWETSPKAKMGRSDGKYKPTMLPVSVRS